MIEIVRAFLRRSPAWVRFREVHREGWRNAWRRRQVQRRILTMPPVPTARTGTREVRVLCWRRDWLNAVWALKSFYFFAGVDDPLFIHDGGLDDAHVQELKRHFPQATIIRRREADARVERELEVSGLFRSLAYRRENVATLKLWDFFLLSRASHILSIDADVLFFRRPEELLVPVETLTHNLFNRDAGYAYSLPLDEIRHDLGVEIPSHANSGLSLIARTSMRFKEIEEWLAHPKVVADRWVTEQTLQVLSSSLYGIKLLPESYVLSTTPGLPEGVVAKHYPGFFRPLLYSEGMQHLVSTGFLHYGVRA